jgi:cytidine deaminase
MTDDETLIGPLRDCARRARGMHYAPYTGLMVLSAVRATDGRLFGGANVEVAGLKLTKHAEECAVICALAAGVQQSCGPRWLEALYVVGAAPCGSCRQFAAEWAVDDASVIVELADGATTIYALRDLLPSSFVPWSAPSSKPPYTQQQEAEEE